MYRPQNEFERKPWLSVENVQWITTLRHPYSRTLSHYHHAIRNKLQANLTLEEFLTQPYGNGFHKFLPNQMTRWHCGTGPCVRSDNPLTPAELQHAMDNLLKMRAVLILEDFSDAQSCTRRQMRHVLKLEAFDDDENTTTTTKDGPVQHRSDTNWETAIRPYLNDQGYSTNDWSLTRPELAAARNATTNTTRQSNKLLGALGLHNDYDLQLYGYARHLCQVLADQYDHEAEALLHNGTSPEDNVTDTTTPPTNQGFAWNSDEMLSISMPVFFGPAVATSSLPKSSSGDYNNPAALSPSYQLLSNSFPLMMYALFILVFVVLSQQRRQRHNVVTFRI